MRRGKHLKSGAKARLAALFVSIGLTAVIAVGSTAAFLVHNALEKVNTFVPSRVACAVDETFDGKTKTNVSVKNTGDTAAFIRAAVVVTWVKSDTKEVSAVLPERSSDYELIFAENTGWITGGDGYYYYQEPIAPGADTKVLIESCKPLKDKPGYSLSVEIISSAIQSQPPTAAQNNWGVTVVNNIITAAPAGEGGGRMKKFLRLICAFILALNAAVLMSFSAAAADASVTYDGNARQFIFEPGSSYSPTDLFDNFKGVMPGDSISQKIAVKNELPGKIKVKIYLRALGAKSGSEEFLSKLNLSVVQNGNSELFAAPADETAGLSDWVCLGTIYPGADTSLDVVLDVPYTLGNDFKNAVGFLDWQFKAEEIPMGENEPLPPPKTGDYGLLPAAGVLLISAVGLLLCKRKNNV